MGTAHLKIRFQEAPAVTGDLPPKLLDEALDHAIPSDLPSDWHEADIFPILYLAELSGNHLMICMTALGEPDQYGRPNLVTRAVVSDNPLFLADPTSMLSLLSYTPIVTEDIIADSFLSVARGSGNYERWIGLLPFVNNRKQLSILVSSLVQSKNAYVLYDDLDDFVALMRLLFLTATEQNKQDLSFESFCSEGFSSGSSARIRGLPSGYTAYGLSKESEKSLKKEDAFLFDFRNEHMANPRKPDERIMLMLRELVDEPWSGFDRYRHLVALREILHELTLRGKKIKKIEDLQGIDSALDRLIGTASRIADLLDAMR